jgi:hypothetical protein
MVCSWSVFAFLYLLKAEQGDNLHCHSAAGSVPTSFEYGHRPVHGRKSTPMPYEAFKTAEVGDEKEGGIELVMLRGTAPSAKMKRNSAHVGSAVSGMPKMGRLK